MSESRSVLIATPATGLIQMIGAAMGAVVAAGGVCFAIGAGTINACIEVYRRCKEGGYPVENLQMAYTPLGNFDGFSQLLASNGFELHSAESPGITFAVNPLTSESLFIVNSGEGIGVISDNKDLIESSIQSFATSEIALALKDMGFEVSIEERGRDKVITAYDSRRNYVDVKISGDATKASIDTRRSRRPKCDIIQQLVSQKLRGPIKKATTRNQVKKTQKNIHIHIKPGGLKK